MMDDWSKIEQAIAERQRPVTPATCNFCGGDDNVHIPFCPFEPIHNPLESHG